MFRFSYSILLNSSISVNPAYLFRFTVAACLAGIAAGLAGTLSATTLHFAQHLAYDYSLGELVGRESFLTGVINAGAIRRLIVLCVCGLVAGGGWWALHRFGSPRVSIASALASPAPRMPVLTTTWHAFLQIVTVGLGSPLGREVAPRELSALAATKIVRSAGLTPPDAHMIVAAAAAAGLAAVYNVPLGGAILALEVLLKTFGRRAIATALIICTIAALVAQIGLGDEVQYKIQPVHPTLSMLALSAIAGPILGAAGYWFARLTGEAKAAAPTGKMQFFLCVLNFAVIGLLSMAYPALLGNGKSAAQLGFDGTLAIGSVAMLLVLRIAVTASSLRAGAHGGVLAPALAVGSLGGILIAFAWNAYMPAVTLGALAVVGATAFLASSMTMPLTAIVLMAELSHMNYEMLFPVVIAVAGSTGVSVFYKSRNASNRSFQIEGRVAEGRVPNTQ
ncbi:chloride channel protein [Paraburkholderia sediminicola]|uniref:chloride channel protein n=1 Tax=Paraburkholderia sediminicola TaxID=458836 RepID=UPI0038BB1BE7